MGELQMSEVRDQRTEGRSEDQRVENRNRRGDESVL